MKAVYCPSCKSKISGKAEKCPECGSIIRAKKHTFSLSPKTAGIVAAVIIAVAGYVLLQIYEHNKPLVEQGVTEAMTNTLKDMDGAEYTTIGIVHKFNSYLQDVGAGELSIQELVFSSGETEDTYRDIKNNNDISISMTTPKGLNTVTYVSFWARTGNEKAFFTYCSALMSIFNPTMNPDTREYVLPQVTGYSKNGETPLREDSTFIIVRTKYIFTYSESKGLNMRIQQMPPLLEEDDTGNPPPVLRQ